ncbi:MAG: non-canonical purine NTP pyrophosphatase [Sphaerochaetaceae bacterium]|jgi:XTP/dITP diphosphohydrolase|nr:non-canonical purine NTP pyrophosphatase [Sphaerochaetaceae bacterium]MDX9808940.1 non-canonical purine NTP pyrophosphatase [Sphaerochaetaceae bacterium]NLV83144.1 non-canonical purine NTP pyrophosphatase [Spirochaetales bacterium]
MELLFASNNRHKLEEIALLCKPHTCILPKDAGLIFEFEETFDTFYENAAGKALHLHSLCRRPVLADDSGLIVDALDGRPGVHTARYGRDIFGYELSAAQKNTFLLNNLKGIPMEMRTARFVCALALVVSPTRIFMIQETVEGFIAETPYGNGGFGYDPVFIVGNTGRTMASLSETEKNEISHRGRAVRRMLAIITTLTHEENIHVC